MSHVGQSMFLFTLHIIVLPVVFLIRILLDILKPYKLIII